MDRRGFTKLLGASTALLAGCVTGAPERRSAGAESDPARYASAELPVPRSEMRQALPQDSIAAITEPAFAADWSETGLAGDDPLALDGTDPVIGVELDGTARAYPLRILRRHEIVNDVLDRPLLVTYCPLCGSSIVARRTVGGEATVFGVSGLLWRGDLVMYDRATRSLWSQILARAINGPQVPARLELVPSALTSLSAWRRQHPETDVLLPPPRSGLIDGASATLDRYRGGYEADDTSIIGTTRGAPDELSRTTLVIGVRHDGVARAYPFPVVGETGVVNDSVAGLPVVVTTTEAGSLAAYERTVGGRTVPFESAGRRYIRAAGSRWDRATGRAVDGRYEGTQLSAANGEPPMFWTGWSSFHPETTVFGVPSSST